MAYGMIDAPTKVRQVMVRSTHPGAFRSGQWAVVIGFRAVEPSGCPMRYCFHVMYGDGVTDYRAASDPDLEFMPHADI